MRGITLVELIVVLAVLGVIAAVSTLAVSSLRRPAAATSTEVLRRARTTAIRQGRAVTISGQNGTTIRFLPDGRAIGAGVDPWTGEPADAQR